MPDNISLQQAALVPLASTTAFHALFSRKKLSLNRPALQTSDSDSQKPVGTILIWGAASSYVSFYGRYTIADAWYRIGLYATQFARLAGYKVIATASPRNFELVASLGAEAVLDYRDPDVVSKLVQALNETDVPCAGVM